MYKGKYLNNNSVPKAAADEIPEEITAEALMEEVLAQTETVPEEATEQAPKQASKKQPKKKASVGTIVFYSLYFLFVVAGVAAIALLMQPLNDWLVSYEASQPETMCQKVYEDHFASPDWSALYELAGLEDTAFEGKDAYSSYMQAKVAAATDPKLSYQETSAGLSGNHKYLVKLDDEKVACFILEPIEGPESSVTGWKLGSVELFFTREHSITVEKLPGQTVTVNGVALDDSYTIRTVSTKAESYLPEGLHGYRCEQQSVTNLLAAPQVSLTDENGQSIPLVADAETGVLKAEAFGNTMEIPQEHKETAIEAAKNYALFAIRKIGSGTLRNYMDPTSQIFKDVISTPAFLQAFTGYKIHDDIRVEDYYSYSDELFSARLCLTMDVHAARGNTKVFEMNTTFFFQKNTKGKFWVIDSTNVNIAETVEQVRLTFMNGDEQVESYMVDSKAATVTLPQVTAPEGKVLKGWAVQSVDDNGNISMSIIFTPSQDGSALVSSAQPLEPMVLHAVFTVEET